MQIARLRLGLLAGAAARGPFATAGRSVVVMDRADIDHMLEDLEAAIKRRARHRGRQFFYQFLECDIEPRLKVAGEPGYVRAPVGAMLERHGHAPNPPLTSKVLGPGGFSYLCKPAPSTPNANSGQA